MSSVHSPLLDISAALLSIGQALDDYFNSRIENAEPLEGSKAEREGRSPIGATETAGTLFTAGWAWTTLGIPSDHLQAASRLIYPKRERTSVNRFAILSLLRVALEVSSLCWWLVNPKITARERMQRTLRLERWSLDHVDRANGYLTKTDEHSETKKSVRDAFQARIDQLAEEHNLQKIRSGSREIPDASDLIGKQFQAMAGIPGDARNIYARLSEVTHGNMFGTLAGYTRPEEREQPTGPGVPLWLICVGAQYSAFGFCHAVATYIRFMGWDEETWTESTLRPQKELEAIAHAANALEASPTVEHLDELGTNPS
jgi:hypothetical protein